MAYIKQEFEESKSRASVADGARSPQVVEDEGVPGNTHEDQQLTDTCHAGLLNLHGQASELLSHLEKLVNEVSAAIDLTKLQFLESMDRYVHGALVSSSGSRTASMMSHARTSPITPVLDYAV